MNMDIGFVFTNFNNSHFTEGAVLSILGSDAGYAPIVIVDNASKVEHVAALRVIEERYENVKVIYNKKNIGYFKGLNVGINYAKIHLKLPLYWFVGNNDLIFPKNLYSQILACKGVLDKYPVVSPNIITVDGVYQNPHVITKISKVREFIYDIYYFNYFLAGAIRQIAKLTHKFTDRDDELQHDVSQEIYQGYGACYILTPTFFQNFDELWSPTFLMYGVLLE